MEAIIAAHEAPDEGSVRTIVIHGALWEMRARVMGPAAANRELQDELREALESLDRGEGVEATPERWKQSWARCEAGGRRIDEAWTRGLIGNLLLPEKLYDFVTAEIAAGRFTYGALFFLPIDAVAPTRPAHSSYPQMATCFSRPRGPTCSLSAGWAGRGAMG